MSVKKETILAVTTHECLLRGHKLKSTTYLKIYHSSVSQCCYVSFPSYSRRAVFTSCCSPGLNSSLPPKNLVTIILRCQCSELDAQYRS